METDDVIREIDAIVGDRPVGVSQIGGKMNPRGTAEIVKPDHSPPPPLGGRSKRPGAVIGGTMSESGNTEVYREKGI